MNIQPTYGPPRSRRTKVCSVLAAGMILGMLLCQLYGYEDFPSVLGGVLPYNNQPLIIITAAAIVLGELLSLPYLLGMYISRLMRVLSAASAGAISGFWFLTSLTNAHAGNSGLFSTTLDLPGGPLPVLWSAVLFGLFLVAVLADTRFRHDASS